MKRWLKQCAKRWRNYSRTRRWFISTGTLLVLFGATFASSFIKLDPEPNTTRAVLDGAWCESSTAAHKTREIINIHGAHLCLLGQNSSLDGVPASALLGEAVTRYPAPSDFPPDLRWTWGLLMLVVASVMGTMIASDVFQSPRT